MGSAAARPRARPVVAASIPASPAQAPAARVTAGQAAAPTTGAAAEWAAMVAASLLSKDGRVATSPARLRLETNPARLRPATRGGSVPTVATAAAAAARR